MSRPLITIVIPSLNQGQFLEEAIRSVISQGYPSYELMVIDGGSSDSSLEIIKQHAEHLSYWVSEKDSGQSHAINKGLRLAKGEIVTWLNSDDYYEPGALDHVAASFAGDPDLCILHGKARLFGEGRAKVIGPDNALRPHQYLPFMRFPQPASFFRRSLLEETGYLREDLHYAMDHELVCRAVLSGKKIAATPRLLAHYRLHPSSKSNHAPRFMKEWTRVFMEALQQTGQCDDYCRTLAGLSGMPLPEGKSSGTVKSFSAGEINEMFYLHLHQIFHTWYSLPDGKKAIGTARIIKERFPVRYQAGNYERELLRMKIIPGIIFKLVRKLRN